MEQKATIGSGNEVLQWHPAVLGWKLFDQGVEVAHLHGSLRGFLYFRIIGTFDDRHFEIKHIKGNYHPFDRHSEKKVIYSIMMEDYPREWDEQGHKKEWGILEDNSYTPRPVILRLRDSNHPKAKPQLLKSLAGRQYSIDLSRITEARGIYAFSDCTNGEPKRLMAKTSCNWNHWGHAETFRAIDFRHDDPERHFVAVISYAAADMARTMGNPTI